MPIVRPNIAVWRPIMERGLGGGAVRQIYEKGKETDQINHHIPAMKDKSI
jgi:hypothetical protein